MKKTTKNVHYQTYTTYLYSKFIKNFHSKHSKLEFGFQFQSGREGALLEAQIRRDIQYHGMTLGMQIGTHFPLGLKRYAIQEQQIPPAPQKSSQLHNQKSPTHTHTHKTVDEKNQYYAAFECSSALFR